MTEKQFKFNAPALSFLNDDSIQNIHQAAIKILEQIGCQIFSSDVLDLLKAKGVRVHSDDLVRIPKALIDWALEKAPSGITIYNRDKEPALLLEQNHVYFGTGSDCPYLLDVETGEQKEFTFEDMRNAIRIADYLPNIDFIMSMGLAKDLDEHVAHQKKCGAMLELSKKPMVFISGPHISGLNDMVKMASIAAGGLRELCKYPNILLLVNPTSPLVHTRDALDKLVFMAKKNLPVIYAPGIMAGGTSPVTIAGAIAQANAEILTGLVVHQLIQPGAPFVYGGGMSPMDMKSGQPTYSAPEAMMAQAGLCQMGRDFYHLPTWGFGGCSASKICDAQAVNEAVIYNLMSAWMGTNLVHDVGYIESGKTYSLELLVLCDEFIGQVRRMMEGILVDDEHLAVDAIERVGPGGTFLADPHTMEHFKNNWQPKLTDRSTRKIWQKNGSLSMMERATEDIRSILDTYDPESLNPDILKKFNQIINKAGRNTNVEL